MNEDLQREIYEAAAEIVTLRHNKSTEFECREHGHFWCAFDKNGPCSGRLIAEEYETLLLEYQKGLVCAEKLADAPAADPVMDAGQAFALALIDRIGDLEARLDRIEFPARYD